MSDLEPITPQQIVKIHKLSQSIGQQCPRTDEMLQIQAKAYIKKLQEKIKYLESQV
jgi:hypothetical protein